MENNEPQFEESRGEVSSWIQENLRIIVSIFIVAAIALGIYSYSQRQANLSDQDIASLLETKDSGDANATQSQEGNQGMADNGVSKGTVVTPDLSQEQDSTYVETAEAGDGLTHLARRALTHTLQNDSNLQLNSEQKVYVEDYLRKNVEHSGGLNPGDQVSFSKDLINQAVTAAQGLSDAQQQNLKQYSQRVAAYR
jgi:hypothetical protein